MTASQVGLTNMETTTMQMVIQMTLPLIHKIMITQIALILIAQSERKKTSSRDNSVDLKTMMISTKSMMLAMRR